MNLLLSILFLMPPSPEVLEQLKRSGEYQFYQSVMEDARKRGMDQASEELMNQIYQEIALAKETKSKVVKRAVVILCDFSDYVGTTNPLHYDSLTNGPFSSGSVKEFYLENSYGNLEFEFILTTVWVRLPQTLAYYANGQYGTGSWPQNAQRMAYDAVLAADSLIDFSQCDVDGNGILDALVIVHAGPGAESTNNPNHIWSHAWSIPVTLIVDGIRVNYYTTVPENAGCGVIAHEMGHRPLGLPDLYDTDNSSEGLGNWSLMAAGSWNGNGNIPAHLDPWCKIRLNFVRVDTVTSNRIMQPIPAVEDSPVVFRLWTNGTTGNRFFLVENRRLKKFDRALPNEGLLIYHIDNSAGGNNNEWYPGRDYRYHYMVALEQADGRWDLEYKRNRGDGGDPWPGTSNSRDFHNYSVPDSKDYGNPMITTYVGVLNISNPGDIMYADLMVSPYNNLKLKPVSIPRADTVNAQTSFVLSLYNNGFSTINASLNFKVYDEGSNLVYDTTFSGISVDTAFAETLTFVFTPLINDHDCTIYFASNTGDDVPRDDSLMGYFYSKGIVRFISVPMAVGGNYYGVHIVDGVVDDYEYYGSEWFDISNFLASGGELHRTFRSTYVKTHIFRDTLFLGFKIVGDSTIGNNDLITLVFDDNGDGVFPASNSNEGELTFRDGTTRLVTFRPYTASGTGSTQTIQLPHAYTVVGNTKYAEIAIPIGLDGTGSAYYLNLPGDYSTFGPNIFVKVTDGARVFGWWPQNTPYASVVRDISYFGSLGFTPVDINEIDIPGRIKVSLRGSILNIQYAVKNSSDLEVNIYDALGRKSLNNSYKISGDGKLSLPMGNLPAGVYFIKVNMDGKEVTSYKGVIVR